MLSGSEPILFASRATSIISETCRSARRTVVLLPALYCAEVATAIEKAGLSYRCYDMPSDLSSASSMIDLAYDRDIGAVVAWHPFGLLRPIHGLTLNRGTLLIEDACHAIRTAVASSSLGDAGHLTVYSPRKEFGWPEGGIATGSLLRLVRRLVVPAPWVEQRWEQSDIGKLASQGRQITRLAFAALPEKLPPLRKDEVLSALPLKSTRRDATISRLRAKGIEAWRWVRPMKDTGPNRTPQAWALRRKLLLVPLPSSVELERTLDLLSGEALEAWEQ
jgi:hypothetical protein